MHELKYIICHHSDNSGDLFSAHSNILVENITPFLLRIIKVYQKIM